IVVWLIVAIAVSMMIFTIVSVNTFDRADRNLFGYKAFIVLSDSMSKTDFSAGDLVLIKEVDPSTLKEGDIIAYTSQNTENYGETVTHKIRRLTTDAKGNPGFITYGTTTDTDDEKIVTYPFVIGKYQTRIPKIGAFFQFLKTTPGYIVCILLPFMLLILIQGLNCIRLFRKYKDEQMDKMREERAKIDAERAESQKMLAELQALKAQLSSQAAGNMTLEKPPVKEAAKEDKALAEKEAAEKAESQKRLNELQALKAQFAKQRAETQKSSNEDKKDND
ncbi:MAG: signal peptidase I, partial [Eubacteriales bacterium]